MKAEETAGNYPLDQTQGGGDDLTCPSYRNPRAETKASEGWSFWSRLTVSLVDMLNEMSVYLYFLDGLQILKCTYQKLPPDAPLSQHDKECLIAIFWTWGGLCLKADFKTCLAPIERLIGSLRDYEKREPPRFNRDITAREALSRIDQFAENFCRDAGGRSFYLIHDDKSGLYDKSFGVEVDAAFPSAVPEIKEAHTCYALGRNTACAFHLMRAIEHVLRAFAIAVGITSPTVPLEFQQWQNIIDQIESKVREAQIDKWPRPAKANARAFFSSIIAQFHSLKDDVRNILMHTRSGGTYDDDRALNVLKQVRSCMEKIAGRVKEDGTQPQLLDSARFSS